MAKNDLPSRILAVTAELRQLEFEIRSSLEHLAENGLAPRPELLDRELVEELRTVLDMSRHTLWSYMEAQGAKDAYELAATLRNYRMNRVAQMLRMLRASEPTELTGTLECESFIEQVQAMAALTLDKHLQPGAKTNAA